MNIFIIKWIYLLFVKKKYLIRKWLKDSLPLILTESFPGNHVFGMKIDKEIKIKKDRLSWK